MSDFANFTDSFQHMGFEEKKKKQANYHELQIEYPVLDLLPVEESVTPLLKKPSFNGYREKPDPSDHHLPLSGTDFIVRLPLITEMPSTPTDKVFTILMTLLLDPGRSLLQIATYTDPDDGEHYRFRLQTECNGQLRTVMESELSGIAWSAERNSFRHATWMQLISHLIGRISNRAYFHVHERLKHYCWYAKQRAEEQWNTKDSFDPKRFFAAHLRVLKSAKLSGVVHRSRISARDLEGDGEVGFLLPCNHFQDMDIPELRSLSIVQCIYIRCDFCGARIAGKDTNWHLTLLLQRQRELRGRFSVRELVWKQIADEFPIGNQQVNISSGALSSAVSYAARSVRLPDSATPIMLNPVKSDLIVQFSEELYDQLEVEYQVTCTSAEIFSQLVDQLDRKVGQYEGSIHELGNLHLLPRAWEAILLLWFTRATQLASVPGYDGEGPIEVYEDAEDAVPDDEEIDELEMLMKDTNLE